MSIEIKEDINLIQKNKILIDYDDKYFLKFLKKIGDIFYSYLLSQLKIDQLCSLSLFKEEIIKALVLVTLSVCSKLLRTIKTLEGTCNFVF